MKPPLSSAPVHRRDAGVGLVTAIFLLVVLSGLGVAMVSLAGAQRQGAALDELGARAYQAARAGIEWGAWQQTRNGGCSGTTSFALPAASALAGFVVTVTCTPVDGPATVDPISGSAGALRVVHMRAEACTATLPATCANAARGPDFVQRVVEAQL